MVTGDRLSRESSLRDQTAELQFRAVLAVRDRKFRWPADESVPAIVRENMEPDIQAHARMHIESAFNLAVEKRDAADSSLVLREGIPDWLAEVSTVPHGRGATNFDRLRDAIAAADRSCFAPAEFDALWRQLCERLRGDGPYTLHISVDRSQERGMGDEPVERRRQHRANYGEDGKKPYHVLRQGDSRSRSGLHSNLAVRRGARS